MTSLYTVQYSESATLIYACDNWGSANFSDFSLNTPGIEVAPPDFVTLELPAFPLTAYAVAQDVRVTHNAMMMMKADDARDMTVTDAAAGILSGGRIVVL